MDSDGAARRRYAKFSRIVYKVRTIWLGPVALQRPRKTALQVLAEPVFPAGSDLKRGVSELRRQRDLSSATRTPPSASRVLDQRACRH